MTKKEMEPKRDVQSPWLVHVKNGLRDKRLEVERLVRENI